MSGWNLAEWLMAGVQRWWDLAALRVLQIAFQLINWLGAQVLAAFVAALEYLPVVTLGVFDLTPVVNMLDTAGWFLPYAAGSVVLAQWASLVLATLGAHVIRGLLKVGSAARGASW